MLFIWRGAGLVVPIFGFICAWIMSYWFDDTRLGNTVYIGWTIFWTSLPLLLLGLAFYGGNLADPETGEKPPKKHHDFFFIPVGLWGILFLGLGLFWINSDPSPGYNLSNNEEILTDEESENEESSYMQRVHLFNPYNDTLRIEINYPTGEGIIDTYVPPQASQYADLDPGKYEVINNGVKSAIQVQKMNEKFDYQDGWIVVGNNYDLIVVDVTAVCNDTIKRSQIEAIDWESMVKERLSSEGLITSYFNEHEMVINAGSILPYEHEEGQKVFTFIPIKNHLRTTEEHLDSMIVNLCF